MMARRTAFCTSKAGAADVARQKRNVCGNNPMVPDPDRLDAFPNPHPARDYVIEHHVHEFTSVCPNTGRPDFATLRICYIADELCVELKGLKLYLLAFTTRVIFYVYVTTVIFDALVERLRPRWMVVESTWSVRGGIHTVIRAEHGTRKNNPETK